MFISDWANVQFYKTDFQTDEYYFYTYPKQIIYLTQANIFTLVCDHRLSKMIRSHSNWDSESNDKIDGCNYNYEEKIL